MQITGAIFDCDGTLVDSMGMWFGVIPELLARYEIFDQDELLDELEPVGIEEECHILHERLGVGASGEAFFAELQKLVRHEYEHSIQAFPGAKDFVASLYEAGIPLIVASSSAPEDIDVCLRVNGMRSYFDQIINTGDVGRSKEFPDVYIHAQGLIGTDRFSTWVFEDAPFGLKSSKSAGFPNVAIYHEPDGRDKAFVQDHCTLFSTRYENISLDRIRAL